VSSTVALVAGDLVATGGMDRANLALASYLLRRGRRVEVVAHRVAPELLASPGLEFHRVPKPLGSYLLGSPLLDRVGRGVAARVLAEGGRVVVNGGNCAVADVNWVHYVHAAFLPRAAPRGWRRAKSAVERRLVLREERRALAAARLVLANSERTRQDLLQCLGVAAERVHVVRLGIDADEFRPAAEDERELRRKELGLDARPVLAFVGALSDSRKGFDTLFEAWIELGKRAWDPLLLVLGHGAELERWKGRAAAAGLGQSIRFLGFCQDVARILPALDGIVAPVRYEAFGQAVHEALCCGLPAVVSSSAGVAEKISGDLRGLLLDDPESPAELCRRLRVWRDDLDIHRGAARSLAANLRRHTWDVMAAEICEAMEG
jgi:glycosyltransferase involved in cell wall biosynthesis